MMIKIEIPKPDVVVTKQNQLEKKKNQRLAVLMDSMIFD